MVTSPYFLFTNDVTVTVLQLLVRIKLCTGPIFQIFYILKINRIMPFCNLFMEQPSYFVQVVIANLIEAERFFDVTVGLYRRALLSPLIFVI